MHGSQKARSHFVKEPREVVEWLIKRATRRDNGCLICHLGVYRKYPVTTINGEKKHHKVHRLVFSVVNGPIPEGLQVLHSCDTPRCIEISHLRLGTNYDNVQDRAKRKRGANQWTGPRFVRVA